jgi:hypothetical protein
MGMGKQKKQCGRQLRNIQLELLVAYFSMEVHPRKFKENH